MNYLLLCDINELSENDKLEREIKLYNIIKANYDSTLEILDMLNGDKFDIYGAYKKDNREVDYSIFG